MAELKLYVVRNKISPISSKYAFLEWGGIDVKICQEIILMIQKRINESLN